MKIEHPSTGQIKTVADIRWPDAVAAATAWIEGKYDPRESTAMARYLAYAIVGMNHVMAEVLKP